MTTKAEPITTMDTRVSAPDAKPVAWRDAANRFASAELYWLATIGQNGQPHITPVIGVLVDDVFYFCTGATEQKVKNLDAIPRATVMTGTNSLADGDDIVIEGTVSDLTDDSLLPRLTAANRAKSNDRYKMFEDAFTELSPDMRYYALTPTVARGFGKGSNAAQTRWQF